MVDTPNEDVLSPGFVVLADEHLTGPAKERVDHRLRLWLENHIATTLEPLVDLRKGENLEGLARGLAFQLVEAFGIIDRRQVAEDVKNLDQTARGSLRKFGVRFGAYHIFIPALLKPAPASLVALLWGLKEDVTDNKGILEVPAMSAAGRTSFASDPDIPDELYRVAGFKVSGGRAVRVDILERLADLIRPLLSWKSTESEPTPPEGALTEFGFTVTVAMTSLLGCSGEDFATVLKSLGYRVERRVVERKPDETADPEKAATPENENATSAEVEEASIQQSNTASTTEPNAPEETVPTADPAPEIAEPVAEENTDATSDQEQAPEEEELLYIEIWRPQPAIRESGNRQNRHNAKGNRSPGDKRQSNEGKSGKPKGKRPHKNEQGGKKGQHHAKGSHDAREKTKPLDPDSPFAKLAALKADMGKK